MSNTTNSMDVAAIEAFIQETFETYVRDIYLQYSILTLCRNSFVQNLVVASTISELFTFKETENTEKKSISLSALYYYIEHLSRNSIYVVEALQSSYFPIYSHQIFIFNRTRASSHRKPLADRFCKLRVFENLIKDLIPPPADAVRLFAFDYLTDLKKKRLCDIMSYILNGAEVLGFIGVQGQ